MAEIEKLGTFELVSLAVGIFSLILTIYFANDVVLQVGFSLMIILSVIIVFFYDYYRQLQILKVGQKTIVEEFKATKERLDIYGRLAKLENLLEGGKMNKKGQAQYVLVILLVLVFLFLIYLAFFKG